MPPIAFNDIPAGIRVPFVFIEFDNTNAQQGPSLQPYLTLMTGPKLVAGTEPELTLRTVTFPTFWNPLSSARITRLEQPVSASMRPMTRNDLMSPPA